MLGGTNSLHTNSLDEALALPTAEAATLALRTQQIIAHESGVTNVVDPLGGSYFVERLTLRHGRGRAAGTSTTIDRMGGMVEAIEQGFPQREIAESVLPVPAGGRAQREDHRRRQRLRCSEDEPPIADSLHRRIGGRDAAGAARASCGRRRDDGAGARGRSTRCGTRRAAPTNTMPPLLECVRAYATVGEMCDALREVWGEYEEVPDHLARSRAARCLAARGTWLGAS